MIVKISAFIITLLFFVIQLVHADSKKAYEDYLYQTDVYRAKYAEFKIAKNEYDKFKTLTSQTDALSKAIAMMSARDQLIRAYLLLLQSKIEENLGLGNTERTVYQTLISKEVTFLENHSKLVESVVSLNDASTTSKQLESHWSIFLTSSWQTNIALSMGSLSTKATMFDSSFGELRQFISKISPQLPSQTKITIDRWFISIQDKKTLYDQKVSDINKSALVLKGSSGTEFIKSTRTIQTQIQEAKTYLDEATSYMQEVLNAVRNVRA